MGIFIREMQEKDIEQVQEVARISWHETYNGIIPLKVQESFLSFAYSEQMLQKRLKVSSLYVAENEGNVVGFANFSPIKNNLEAELGAIYLLPEFQGKGIGTALLEKGLENLEEVAFLYVDVEKENKSGTIFYEAKGFEKVSEFDDDLEGHITRMVRLVLKVE